MNVYATNRPQSGYEYMISASSIAQAMEISDRQGFEYAHWWSDENEQLEHDRPEWTKEAASFEDIDPAYRVEGKKNVTMNGRRTVFSLYKRTGDAYVMQGHFTAAGWHATDARCIAAALENIEQAENSGRQ